MKFSIKTKRKQKNSPWINENNIKYLPSRQEPVKVYSRNTGTRWEVCPKLTKTPERCHWGHASVFIVNSELFHTLIQCFYCWLWASNCQILIIFAMLHCCILVQYAFSYRRYWYMVHFLISATCKVRHLLEGRRLLEGDAYFDEDNQSCGNHLRPSAY